MLAPDIKDDLNMWVKYVFPWGKKNSPLEHYTGLRGWQREILEDITIFLKDNKRKLANGEETDVYKLAVSSGRGIGKSSLAAILALWNMSCNLGSSTMITANTDAQLTNRTFGEIGKWATLLINNYWFDRMQKAIVPAEWWAQGIEAAEHIDRGLWYIKGELWSEENTDAFAGMHNECGEMIFFDEASGIPESIWRVSEGVFTEKTPYKFFITTSNPRSNSGAFYDCFYNEKVSKYWRTRKIDGRTVEGSNKKFYNEVIEKHGAESRDARVEVYGEFPEIGDKQFISRAVVEQAVRRELSRMDDYEPLRMGIDVARYGNDHTVIRFRRGRDARSIPAIVMSGADNMAVANKCMELIDKFKPDAVFCDSGAGTGVIDRMKECGYKVFEVQFGSAAEDAQYFDHRTEIWARMRDWLQGAQLGDSREDDKTLIEELIGPEFEYVGREGKIKLESKESMKKRKLKSPDQADALAVTFHCQVARLDEKLARGPRSRRAMATGVGCDVKWD